MNRLSATALLFTLGLTASVPAQVANDIRELKLRDWEPRSMLVGKSSNVARARFPVIDVHNHLGGGKGTLSANRVTSYLSEMDATGVQTVVNLDGGWDERLMETLAALDNAHPRPVPDLRLDQLQRDR